MPTALLVTPHPSCQTRALEQTTYPSPRLIIIIALLAIVAFHLLTCYPTIRTLIDLHGILHPKDFSVSLRPSSDLTLLLLYHPPNRTPSWHVLSILLFFKDITPAHIRLAVLVIIMAHPPSHLHIDLQPRLDHKDSNVNHRKFCICEALQPPQ